MTRRAQIVLPGEPFAETLTFFRERLGMRLLSIHPADEPRVAIVAGHGLQLRLDTAHTGAAGLLHVEAERDEDLIAPNGTRVELRAPVAMQVPPPTGGPAVIGGASDRDWTVGRAGMLYRDLIPGRLGGAVIASHIRIPDGGPVPDDVHFHDVAFQMIHCVRGWVRLVYQDQGGEFELQAGQTLLQPPQIRHRVLACSDGLEVVEVSSPAEHLTSLDHELPLPNDTVDPARTFSGQRFFVRRPGTDGELDFADATAGRARVDTVTVTTSPTTLGSEQHIDFAFVLRGSGTATIGGQPQPLVRHGALTLPPGHTATITADDGSLEALHVQLLVD